MSWRDDLYSPEEQSMRQEIQRLHNVCRELEEENRELQEKLIDVGDSCVVVINRNYPVPLRHVVAVDGPYRQSDFVKSYYSQYHNLDGDDFVYCATRKIRDDFLNTLEMRCKDEQM